MTLYHGDPSEEKIFDYRPDVREQLQPVHTIDGGSRSLTTGQVDPFAARQVTRQWMRLHPGHVIRELSTRRKFVDALLSDYSQRLLSMSYSVDMASLSRGVLDDTLTSSIFHDIMGPDGRLEFETYSTLPDTEEYKPIHDLWFRRSSDTQGHVLGEGYPVLRDISSDLDQIGRIADIVLLDETGMNRDTSPEVVDGWSESMGLGYENLLDAMNTRLAKGDATAARDASLEARKAEHLLQYGTDACTAAMGWISALDDGIETLSTILAKEEQGEYADSARASLETLQALSPDPLLAIPLLKGFKTVHEAVVRDRLSMGSECSKASKDALVEKALRYGRTYTRMAVPLMASMTTQDLPSGAQHGLSHLADGLAAIAGDARNANEAMQGMARREAAYRGRILRNVDYKNLSRLLYNSMIGG